MKKRYVFAALAAMTVFAGCGDNASQQKNTDNTTQESTAEDDLTAADPDEDGEELDPEFSQDVENNEVIDAKGRLIDGHVYLDYNTVYNYINPRFYWDSNENILRYTTLSLIHI